MSTIRKTEKKVLRTNNPWYLKLYTYADGSGNRYVFSWNGLEYFPVDSLRSSSGTYHGGTYIKKVPDTEKYYKTVDAIIKAKDSKEDHTDKREMMTARIEIWSSNNKEEEFILKSGSKWIVEVETLLKEIKSY